MAQIGPQLFITAAAGLLGRILLKNSRKTIVDETTGTALNKRGSRIPYLIGTDKLGSLSGFIGDYEIKKEKVQGKKGGSAPKQDVYYETGWHHLSIGPGVLLEEIQENGELFFKGPLTPTDTPSGTEVNIGNGETFIVFWGEQDQAINTEFDQKTGIASRWPWLFSIWWKNKRLGTSHTWPLLEYIAETELVTTLLTDTPGSIELPGAPLPTSYGIFKITDNTDSFWIRGHHATEFPNGTQVEITGTGFGDLDGIRIVNFSENRTYTSGTSSFPATEIYPEDPVTGDVDNTLPGYTGEVRGYSRTLRRRNPAHMIAQLLFSPLPHGRGYSTETFDIESLEAVGVRCQAEGILGRLLMQGNDKIEDAIGKLMLDMNCMIYLDTRTGKYKFRLLRELAGNAPFFSRQFLHENDPESTVPLLSRPVNRPIYSFRDRENNYEETTVGGIDDDGAFHRLDNADAEIFELTLPNEVTAASVIGELRSQGDLGEGSALSVDMMRGARELVPSQQIEIEGVLERVIVSSVGFHQGENRVTIEAVSDYLSARLSSFEHRSGAAEVPEALFPMNPLAARILEIPAYISPGVQLLGVPVIRAHQQIAHHELWISATGTTYTHAGRQTQVQTGGILQEDLDEFTTYLLPEGPLFTPLGSDLQGRVLDLTGNETEWRAGRQVAVINGEIFFLEGVVAVGGQWRLGRMLRARFDTRREQHLSGSEVFIFEATELFPIQDILLYPGADIFVKPQAVGNGSVPIENVIELSATLEGKGVAPLAPTGLRARGVDLPTWCRAWGAGDDIEIRWQWQSFATRATGAGMQPSGDPTGPADIQGEFKIEIRASGGSLEASYFTADTFFTYANSQLVADFSVEPSSFRVRVIENLGGRLSSYCEILLQRI